MICRNAVILLQTFFFFKFLFLNGKYITKYNKGWENTSL